MVTGLIQSDFLLKPQDLSSVLAKGAIHCCFPAQHLLNPLNKGVEDVIVIPQVRRMEEFHFGMILSNAFGVLTNTAHEHA